MNNARRVPGATVDAVRARWATVFALVLQLGCEGSIGGSDSLAKDGPNGDVASGCVDDVESLFADTVLRPTLSGTCLGCHNREGAGKDSGFVLVGSEEPDSLRANLEAFERVARARAAGDSLVLQKISGQVPHKGGVLALPTSDTYRAFLKMVWAIDNPCPTQVEPSVPYYDGVVLLDETQTLRKATFELASRYPTSVELDAVRGLGIEAIDGVLDAVMQEEAFYTRIKEVFNDVFLTEGLIYPIYFLPEAADGDFYGDNYEQFQDAPDDTAAEKARKQRWRQELGKAMTSEPLHLVEWLLRNDLPFSELLTADYTVVNPFSARFYGVPLHPFSDPENPDERLAVSLPDRPQAGVMSTVSFLEKYPTTQTNRNRARSRVVYKMFLATNVLALDSSPLPSSAVSEPAAWMHNPACTVCHDRVDPVAGCFQDYNDYKRRIGRFRPQPWFEDMRPPGFNGTDAPAVLIKDGKTLPWLAQQIVADRRFALAMAQILFTGLTGQAPLVEPTDTAAPDYNTRARAFEAQRDSLHEAADAYWIAGHDLRALLKNLVKSPWFRAIDADVKDPNRLAELGPLGTARVLSPEKLARRLKATFGYSIFEDIDRVWTGGARGFKLLYGGIDSRGSTVRASSLNAVMAGVAERMANEVACEATPKEFARPANERQLFAAVEPEQTSTNAPEAILGTIIHLHERFFGARLTAEDPDIIRTFHLFQEVQTRGIDEVAAGRESTALPSECRYEISEDPTYSIRAWMAVVTFMLNDYRFIHD